MNKPKIKIQYEEYEENEDTLVSGFNPDNDKELYDLELNEYPQ